ncbi:hypothetical protein F5141DRAFT_1086113, partial [Pisolithus sp. B1]
LLANIHLSFITFLLHFLPGHFRTGGPECSHFQHCVPTRFARRQDESNKATGTFPLSLRLCDSTLQTDMSGRKNPYVFSSRGVTSRTGSTSKPLNIDIMPIPPPLLLLPPPPLIPTCLACRARNRTC